MGHADYYKHGSHNAICDRCGGKFKGDELRKTWDGLWVCKKDWEPRHPQDFIRAVEDTSKPPYVRSEAADVFLSPGEVTQGDL